MPAIEKTLWNRWFDIFLSPMIWGPSLLYKVEGKLLLKNDLQARISKQCVSVSKQNAGDSMFLWLMKGKKENVFMHLSISSCLGSKMRGLQVCTEELISRVKAICFPALCEPCEHFPRSYWDSP